MKTITCRILAATLLVSWTSVAHAQQFTGGIRGRVSDTNGVVPGATVSVTNEATNVSRDSVTNEAGEYNFPALPPALYSIRASLPGYKTFERRGIRIATQQFVILDLTLEIGTIEETITVTADAPLIETSNASHGGVLDREILEELPSHGRNAFLVGTSVPTVLAVGEPRFNRQQDQMVSSQISLGGGGVQANNYTLDGVPITDLRGFPGTESNDRSDLGHQGSSAHLRRGDGAYRRRRLQHDGAFWREHAARLRVLSDPSGVGVGARVFREETGRHEGEQRTVRFLLPPVRRRPRRADPQGSHVLLVRQRRLSRSGDPRADAHVAQRATTHRRLLDDHAQRRAGSALQSVLSQRCGDGPMPGNGHRIRSRAVGSSQARSSRRPILQRIPSPSRWRATGRNPSAPTRTAWPT